MVGSRLARPYAAYRADDDTCEELQSGSSDVVVRRAWIDTGAWSRAKPRWIGFEDGVAIPHRRALFGRTYVHLITRRSSVSPIVPLDHGPPDPARQSVPRDRDHFRHGVAGMVAWRLLVLGLGFTFVRVGGGTPFDRLT